MLRRTFHYCPGCGADLWQLKDWANVREEVLYYPEHPKEGTRFPEGGWPSNAPNEEI